MIGTPIADASSCPLFGLEMSVLLFLALVKHLLVYRLREEDLEKIYNCFDVDFWLEKRISTLVNVLKFEISMIVNRDIGRRAAAVEFLSSTADRSGCRSGNLLNAGCGRHKYMDAIRTGRKLCLDQVIKAYTRGLEKWLWFHRDGSPGQTINSILSYRSF